MKHYTRDARRFTVPAFTECDRCFDAVYPPASSEAEGWTTDPTTGNDYCRSCSIMREQSRVPTKTSSRSGEET